MRSVADHAADFVENVKLGKQPRLRIHKKLVPTFIAELLRLGMRFADECLETIRDSELRQQIRTVLHSAAAGAAIGLALGSMMGPSGAAIGAFVGTAIGTVAGLLVVRVWIRDAPGSGDELIIVAA